MGKYEAKIPQDRFYSKHHMWMKRDQGSVRIGFTTYSVRMLQDVYFLAWSIDAPAHVKYKQEIGEVESSKAISALYAPCEGTVVRFNDLLLGDPSGINADNYGNGWLLEMETTAEFLTAQEYLDHLNATWEKDQRTIKGQINEDS
jgi:glycine cleavage system H protein